MLGQAVIDQYRCPEEFFDFVLSKQQSTDQGYFRFGRNTLCFGHYHSGTRGPESADSLYDAIKDVKVHEGNLSLPFDPSEIIDNLRLERYANTWEMETSYEALVRRFYYCLRPLTNLTVRKQIQRLRARNWKKRTFPQWPVDTTVENICETLLLIAMQAKGVDKVPFVWFWPGGACGCLAMTHDVETRVGMDHCADLMDVDEAFGIKAAFGIVPEERYRVVPSLLELMRNRGFEVFIQDLNHDGLLFDNKQEFLRRVKRINRYGREYNAAGFRAAVLYRRPEWYDAFEFAFDMSVPNVAHLDPQPGGCCTVMPYFIGDILELPVTTIQDYTLFHVLRERRIDLWKDQVDRILGKSGLVSFIVHPDYIIEHDTLSLYKILLGYFQELRQKTRIWAALPGEVDSWWRARNKMSVVKDGNSWRIVGDRAERAVLAFAKNVDGNLVYELA